jgi:hypothetical protein
VSDEQIALASPPVNEAWNRLSPCDDRSMTPGRLVSLGYGTMRILMATVISLRAW